MLSIPPKRWPDFDYRQAAQDLAGKIDDAEYIAERFEFGVGAVVRTDHDVPLPHIVYHSPTGLEYGYGGSGPADLARSIITHAMGLPIADRLYQDFKFEFVATAKDRFSISLNTIREWVVRKLREKEAA